MFTTMKRMAVTTAASGKPRLRTTANIGFPGSFGSSTGLTGSTSVSVNGASMLNNLDTMMLGLIPEDEQSLLRFYRDIYTYDVIGGAAVDLMATLPFSSFTLVGGDDKELDVFYKNLENLQINTLLPDMSVEYLTSGRFAGTMLYDEVKNEFTDIIPHAPENINVIPSPLYAGDPLIVSRVTNEMRAFLSSNEPHFKQLVKRIPETMVRAMRDSPNVVLDPLATLFIPRRTSTRGTGTSIYRRLLPIYLLEKVLYRGTITEANKRQRSITHVTMGTEYFEPQDIDLQETLALFQQADLDPLGAFVATRSDVAVSDIRAGGDFWKWTDILDATMPLKLKALGVSDAFLSGEANWNTADAALSVFLEQLRAYRDMIEDKIFYNKIFPIISTMNQFRSSGAHKRTTLAAEARERMREMANNYPYTSMDNSGMPSQQNPMTITDNTLLDTSTLPHANSDAPISEMMRKRRNASDLLIPEIHWHKQLRPEADREYLDVLNTLSEHGVPITLRAWAAAGGVSIEHLTEELKEDVILRKKISDLVAKHNPEAREAMDSVEGDEFASSLSKVYQYLGGNRRIPILSRDFGEASEAFGRTKTGKKKFLVNQRKHVARENEIIARSLGRLSDANHFEKTKAKVKTKRSSK